jgi:hypothetical protein
MHCKRLLRSFARHSSSPAISSGNFACALLNEEGSDPKQDVDSAAKLGWVIKFADECVPIRSTYPAAAQRLRESGPRRGEALTSLDEGVDRSAQPLNRMMRLNYASEELANLRAENTTSMWSS